MDWKVVRRGFWKLSLFAAAAVAMATPGQDQALSQRVDLFLKEADLLAATQVLTKQTGIQFVIQPSTEPFGKITLSLSGVTAEQAIKYLCEAAGGWAERDENGVYIIRRGERPAPTPAQPNPQPTITTPEVQRPRVVRKVKLMKADPKDVYDMLTKGYMHDPVNGFKEVRRFSEFSQGYLTSPQSPTISVVGLGAGVAYPTSNVGNQDRTNFPTNDNANDVWLPGESARQLTGGGNQPFGGGQPTGGGQTGAGGQGTALTPGQGLVPTGIDFISYDPTDNSLVVRGDEEAVRRLQQNIALFDVAPEQVLIKVEFITTSQGLSRSLGIDWLYQRGAVVAGNNPGFFARNTDPIFINYATGNISTRLRTALATGQGRVVNAPIVRTLNNQPASVLTTTSTTIFVNQVINGPGGVTTVPQPLSLTVTTALIVRPRINGDRTITMTLTPQIQDFGQVRIGPDGQEIPDQLGQAINVVARVKDGETIVLAGLTRKSDQSSQRRFPILGDLPIIGQFFRDNRKEQNNSELLIFVTPTIIRDDEAGVTGP